MADLSDRGMGREPHISFKHSRLIFTRRRVQYTPLLSALLFFFFSITLLLIYLFSNIREL